MQRATEHLCDERGGELFIERWCGWWHAGCDGEGVDELEDKEAREGTAKVGHAVSDVRNMHSNRGSDETYVARSVM